MTNNINIPKKYLVLIDGEAFDRRDRNIVKDFFTEEWINLNNIRYLTYNTPEFVMEGYFRILYRYAKCTNIKENTFKVLLQNDINNPSNSQNFTFKNKKEFIKFCDKYDFVKGVNNDKVYFQRKLLKYDRKKPIEFKGIKTKKSVEEYLNYEIQLNDNKVNSKEYKELLDIINIQNQKYGLESSTFVAFEGLRYSYGIELETISGCVYDKLIRSGKIEDLNLSGVFDGSLRDYDGSGPWGQEYITGVLKGDAGLKQIYDISSLLRKNCTVDERCAYHVHIGSLNWNSEDIVFMYILGLILEEEIFSIMPNSRRNNNYCKRLTQISKNKIDKLANIKNKKLYNKNISDLYNTIFNIVGKSGNPNRFLNKYTQHPKGRHGGYDREVDHRYSWLNFTNIVFNQRGALQNKTIEYRIHSGTLSYTKIVNWLKICMAITEFVHIGKKDIISAILSKKTINLEYIISKVYPKTSSKLIDYIQTRKNLFSDISNENIDYLNENSNIKNLKELVCA